MAAGNDGQRTGAKSQGKSRPQRARRKRGGMKNLVFAVGAGRMVLV